MADTNTSRLRHLLENKLPQELYDRVYDLTFTAAPGVRHITRHFRIVFKGPDSLDLLQVDRASRGKFAASLFGGSGAVFLCCDSWISLCKLLSKVLTSDHCDMLRDVRVVSRHQKATKDPRHPANAWFTRVTQWNLKNELGTEMADKVQVGREQDIISDIDRDDLPKSWAAEAMERPRRSVRAGKRYAPQT